MVYILRRHYEIVVTNLLTLALRANYLDLILEFYVAWQ